MTNSKTTIRGMTDQLEVPIEKVIQDTQSSSQKFKNSLQSPETACATLISFAIIVIFIPQVGDVLFIGSILFTIWVLTSTESVPIKLPIQYHREKRKIPALTKGNSDLAQGIFFMGNEVSTNKEIWLSNTDCRQHILVLGTTGAGKTETLLGFAANALSWGSGFLFCDGKGDVSLFAKIYAMARRLGREDDIVVLNYMTGNTETPESEGKLRSNTLNPFSTGTSDSLSQLIISLMEETGNEGAMWKGRAAAMFTGVMRALVWQRDKGSVDLNVSVIRDHLNLQAIIDLADPEKHADMPKPIRKSINSYLSSLPSFKADAGYEQSQTTVDQHGYLEMQFTKILSSLADVYGHIFKTPYGEVDMSDVVLNRRILVIMLPALEKSRDEVSNLGKIIVATLKSMMGSTLGNEIEGNWKSVVENRPSYSPSPFICILDEVGYYTVGGMDLMSAQARSLGFTMIYAGQDINAMKSLNEKVFGSIQGNTNTKVIMRTEDPETSRLAISSAGKGYRAEIQDFKKESKEFSKNFKVKEPYRLEKTDRVNFLDLKSQNEGEMHIIFKDKVVRANSFYAAPEFSLNKRNLKLRTNHFITVKRAASESIESIPIISKVKACLIEQQSSVEHQQNSHQTNDSQEKHVIDIICKSFDQLKNFSGTNQHLTGLIVFGCVQTAMDTARGESANFRYLQKRKRHLNLENDDEIIPQAELDQRGIQQEIPLPDSPYLLENSLHTESTAK